MIILPQTLASVKRFFPRPLKLDSYRGVRYNIVGFLVGSVAFETDER